MILLYDKSTRRYRDYDSGRFISRNAIYKEVERIADHTSRKLVALSNQLRDGELTVSQWQSETRDALRPAHTLAAQIAGGGKAQMTPTDWLIVARDVKAQYRYLNNFAAEIAAGSPIHMGRVRMYAQAVRHTFQRFELHRAKQAGIARAEWVVTVGENCAGCLQAQGVYLIENVPVIGSHQCLTNCRCFIEYL